MSVAAVLGWLVAYRYLIILPLVIVEGPLVMLACGFLIRLGGFDLLPTYLLLMGGDFVGDVAWYYGGRYAARPLVERFGHFFSISMNDVHRFEELFKTHQVKILFISKITMGFGFAFATLLAAGAARVPFRMYAILNLAGGFIWTAFLLFVGYLFGHLYFSISTNLRLGYVIAIALVAFAFIYSAGRMLRRRLDRML